MEFRVHDGERLRSLEGAALASFQQRAVAFVIDLLAVALTVALLGLPAALRDRAPGAGVVVPFDPFHGFRGVGAMVAYFAVATWLGRGRTLGKRLLGIRVVSLLRDELTLWQCVERALGYGASALEAGFGFVQYFLHPNRQTVHDRIAETIVVRRSSADGPGLSFARPAP